MRTNRHRPEKEANGYDGATTIKRFRLFQTPLPLRVVAERTLQPVAANRKSSLPMNWLAHAFLSNPDIEFRLGNVLADLVKDADRASMPAAFQAGLRQHQEIDAFTDAHEIVQE